MAFQKGVSGNPGGKPKGTPNSMKIIDVKKITANANARAMDNLESVLGKAHSVIDEALDDGNTQVAMWTLDRVIGKGGASLLPEAVDITLNSIDAVIKATQAITEMVLWRKLSIDDGVKMLNLLSNYASFRAFERIDELRAAVDELKRVSDAKTIDGHAVVPSWGRLSEGSATASKKPCE